MKTEVSPDGVFILDQPVQLPDVLDIIIVGGGPAGTAAAFRARELGLSALVVDYDDLMKRIRDYAKDKLILPHFGGGDQMQFPRGGELLDALCFDPIDKDDMCALWKGYYRSFNIPAKIGIELTGIEHLPDGTIQVQTWNHRSRSEELFLTRHLVLAIGRGVPRRFNIPGNTDGITYRLDDAGNYVGGPVCIIGGGTSAAEAVIAISSAKVAANDDCPVYWSYRGDKMPKVSKALSDVFFDAYVGNGNIRYFPRSEPVAIVTGPDRNEYLSIRVDRRLIEGRSIETTHLEFPKTSCIACIGEDIPESFLNSMGIHMTTGGPKNKKRMVVTPLLETQQPNVYLIGDILSQVYFEVEDHEAGYDEIKEIRHRGNVKSALRDGVFIAEVVKQKLEGQAEIRVQLDFQEKTPPPEPGESFSADTVVTSFVSSPDSSVIRNPDEPVENELADLGPRLIRLTASDVEEDEVPLQPEGRTLIGQGEGHILLPEDSSVVQRHAFIDVQFGNYVLHDDGSPYGVFLRLAPGELRKIPAGTLLQLGRQFLMFTQEESGYQMTQYDQSGKVVKRHPLSEGTIVAGRDAPDIVLDSSDMILSRRHLIISVKNGELFVKDPGSLNKTYMRVKSPTTLKHDDVFRIGPHIFRLSLEAELPKDSTTYRIPPSKIGPSMKATSERKPASDETVAVPPPAPAPSVPKAPAPSIRYAPPSTRDTGAPSGTPSAAEPASNGAPSIQFAGVDGTFSLAPSESVLEAARSNDVPLKYECQAGSCGYDPIRIVSGSEYLNEVDDESEEWTLEEICHLEPGNEKGKCRLACMTKVTGPVVVEIVNK